jgi:hypothetical protein
MSGPRYSRRETIKMLAAVPALSAAARPLQGAATAPRQRSVRLGGPLPGAAQGTAADPVELARSARQLGYRAMLCPQVDLKDTARIRAIEAACKAEDVVIAEVGAFGFNMMARDAAERKAALDTMCARLSLADEVGALCAVNIRRQHLRLSRRRRQDPSSSGEPQPRRFRHDRGERPPRPGYGQTETHEVHG